MERKWRFFYLFASLALLVNSCTTRYIPVESVRVDSVYVSKVQRDSIYEKDSVFVAVKADTVFISRVLYRYRDKLIRDTVSVIHSDTITKVVEVERELSRAERLKMNLGGGVLWAIPILIALYVLYRKIKK